MSPALGEREFAPKTERVNPTKSKLTVMEVVEHNPTKVSDCFNSKKSNLTQMGIVKHNPVESNLANLRAEFLERFQRSVDA